jgi:hypothetical protein
MLVGQPGNKPVAGLATTPGRCDWLGGRVTCGVVVFLEKWVPAFLGIRE